MTWVTIIVALAALAVGIVAGWLLMRSRTEQVVARQGAIEKEVEMLNRQCDELRANASEEKLRTEQLHSEKADLQAESEAMRREIEHCQERLHERDAALGESRTAINTLREQLANQMATLSTTTAERDTARREAALLKEQMLKDEKTRAEAFDRQLQVVQEQLKNETRQLLEQRADALGKSNNEQMSNVVKPLKEQLEAVQKQLKEGATSSSANRASIEKAIDDLMKRTIEMSNEAGQLTRALRGDNRTQGNWGEMVLETLLDNSGLERGVHYDTQVILRDEGGRSLNNELTGQRMIPDVVVHFPDNKDVIIDSKVSLTAYLEYCNATSDNERDIAASRHLSSLRQHVRELRMKNYTGYIKPPRKALPYMMMFVPNEMALQLAMHTDPTFWRESFENGIFITSEQNLIIMLRIIHLSWTQVQQYENQQQIIAQASTLLDRVVRSIERFDKVSSGIDRLRNDFDEARTALVGRQGVLAAAKTMEKLGAKTSQQRLLPEPSDDTNETDNQS